MYYKQNKHSRVLRLFVATKLLVQKQAKFNRFPGQIFALLRLDLHPSQIIKRCKYLSSLNISFASELLRKHTLENV